MRRTLALITAVVGTVVLLAAPAAAQYEGGLLVTISTDTPNPPVGSQVNILGAGCPPGSTVTLFVDGVSVGTATADADGEFAFVITAPSTPGPVEVTAQCGDEPPGVAELTLNVVAAGAGAGAGAPGLGASAGAGGQLATSAAAGGQLATTGSDTFPIVRIGAVLLAVGGIAVLATRRQRRSEPGASRN